MAADDSLAPSIIIEDWIVTKAIYDSVSDLKLVTDKNKDKSMYEGYAFITPSNMNVVLMLSDSKHCPQNLFLTEPTMSSFKLKFTFCVHSLSSSEDLSPIAINISIEGKNYLDSKLDSWLRWINSKASSVLLDTGMSSAVCDFTLHESLTYFPILHSRSCYTAYSIPSSKIIEPSSNNKFAPIVLPTSKTSIPVKINNINTFLISAFLHIFCFSCPICLDTQCPLKDAEYLDCKHMLCNSCLASLLRFSFENMFKSRQNTFICPLGNCGHPISMKQLSSHFKPKDIDTIKLRLEEIASPFLKVSHLNICPLRSCGGSRILRSPNFVHNERSMVYCSDCGATFCENCLMRYSDDHRTCDDTKCMRMCRRYFNYSEETKVRVDEIYPWMRTYVSFKICDSSAIDWVKKNAAICPSCGEGIEKTFGCNHISCKCGADFCYSCGDFYHPGKECSIGNVVDDDFF